MTQDNVTSSIALLNQTAPKSWCDFFEQLRAIDVPPDFMVERPLNVISTPSGIFDDDNVLPGKAGDT